MYMQHLVVLGELPPPKKVPNEDCQTKPLTKQCAFYVKIIHIFCYGKIGTLCSSTLNDVREARLYQLISIPTATARGQQGTGLCRKLAVDLHQQTHSIHSLDTLCCPHQTMEHPASTTGVFAI